MKIAELEGMSHSSEQEPKKTLYLVYRDNQLFHALSRGIIGSLESLHYNVISQVFPEGTDEKDIETWINQNADELGRAEFFGDETVIAKLPEELRQKLSSSSEIFSKDNLDKLTERATMRVLFGEQSLDKRDELKEDLETTKQAMVELVRRILNKPENVPTKVFISSLRLFSHDPFVPKPGKHPEPASREATKLTNDIFNQLKTWLIEAGISENNIQFFEGIGDGKENWFIADRHAGEEIKQVHNMRKLLLPIQSFYESAMREGLIALKPEELEQAVEREIKKRLAHTKLE